MDTLVVDSNDANAPLVSRLAMHLWVAWSGMEPSPTAKKAWDMTGVEGEWHKPWGRLADWMIDVLKASGGDLRRLETALEHLEDKPWWCS